MATPRRSRQRESLSPLSTRRLAHRPTVGLTRWAPCPAITLVRGGKEGVSLAEYRSTRAAGAVSRRAR